MNDYLIAGYEGKTNDSIWSSACWLAYQAGKACKEAGIVPTECKMSRGYNVRVNKVYIVKFDDNLKVIGIEKA